jgi:arginase
MASQARTSISLIFSPFHVGLRDQGIGAGPSFLQSRGLIAALESLGVRVRELEVCLVEEDFEGEIGRSFELLRQTSKLITQEHNAGAFPIVLAGNCCTSIGVASGLQASQAFSDKELSFAWFDAHDDFNTPDSLVSGYFDSMAVAMLGGLCWKTLLNTIPGYRPWALQKLVHVGMRDVTDLERSRVIEADLDIIWGCTEMKVDFSEELRIKVEQKSMDNTVIHIDLDSLDNSIGAANKFACPGGLLHEDLDGCLRTLAAKTRPASLTIASLDPTSEGSEAVAKLAVSSITSFVQELIKAGIISP